MGQTNSTNGARRTPSAPSNVLVSPAVAAVNHGQSEVRASPTSPDTGSRSRIQEHRRSLRNSVVGLMSPSSSTQNGEGDASRSGVESGKWWRRSRRWSKTPAVSRPDSVGGDAAAGLTQPILEDLPSSQAAREPAVTNASLPNYDIRSTSGDDSTPQSSVDEPPLDRANLISETTSHHGARSNTLISKGKETSSDVSATARLAQGDSKEGEQTNQPSASRQSSSLDSASPPRETEAAPTIDQVSEGRSGSIVNEVPSPASSQTETRPPQDNHPLRQFPPAGALVVVQGVVHTTDSARQTQGETGPAPQSGPPMLSPTTDADVSQQQHSRPSTGPQGNGLLANLLRRRNSTTSLGPRTSVDPGIVEGPVLHDSHELSGVEPGEVASTSALRRSVETTPSTVPIPGEGGARRSGQLSSSSVDVLGTLLSVATAATAASLLSSSGNQALSRPPQASIPSESAGLPPSNAAAGSAIPALARALASANPTAAAAIAQRDRERDREENERNRVRTLWESLRERLVHGRGGRELVPGSETAGFSRPGGLPTSASGREQGADGSVIPDPLFSELARAFNLGPSQEERRAESQNAHVTPSVGEANFSASTQSQDTRVRREVEDAPPDSFERFLVDLQVDLRIALTRMDSAPNRSIQSFRREQAQSGHSDPRRGCRGCRRICTSSPN
ncbi:hypothetical protein DFH11DRAFT_172734 [Phellopilus nigrolimitatus]|nr:hypothetical protein DFH11DRAFT_172734 [Phellopilus nigrolimitatus]